MKKVLLPLLLVAMLSTNAFAFFTSSVNAPSTGKLQQPTSEYELDTWGSNSEVYEFTPQTNKSMTCVVFMNDAITAITMQCFKKDK